MRKMILGFAAAAALSLGAMPAAEAFTLSVVPQSSTVSLGEQLSVSVVASGLSAGGAPSLGAYDVDFSFDSSLLSFAGITFGSGLDVLGLGSLTDYSLTSAGVLDVFEVSFDEIADLNQLQSDAFTLFTLTFNTSGAGLSALNLTLQSASTAEGTALTLNGLDNSSVAVAPVPLPAAGWLLLSGLTGAFGIARRRRAGLSTPR